MKKSLTFGLIVFCLFVLAACGDNDSNNNNLTEMSSLNGSSNTLEVDRISDLPDVQYPSDELDESDYEPTEEVVQHSVTFSEDGQTVTIEPGPMDISGPISGTMITDEEDSRSYEIDEGLEAMGRFVVWKVNDEFEAELTAYGSGVPIVQSERGPLYRD